MPNFYKTKDTSNIREAGWKTLLRWLLFFPAAIIGSIIACTITNVLFTLLVPSSYLGDSSGWLVIPIVAIAIGAKVIPKGSRIFSVLFGILYCLLVVVEAFLEKSLGRYTSINVAQTWFGLIGGIASTLLFGRYYDPMMDREVFRKHIRGWFLTALYLLSAFGGIGLYVLSIVQALQGHNHWYVILLVAMPIIGQVIWAGVMWAGQGFWNSYSCWVFAFMVCYLLGQFMAERTTSDGDDVNQE